jgi:mannose-1-phosphate guanylyltransferase
LKYVILAGGSGTRLWPLSRAKKPKQFLCLENNYSLIQNTALRVSKKNGEDIFVITTKNSKKIIYKQLKQVLPKFKKENLIIEPIGRNTAPAIAFGSLFFDPDDIIVILSADHYIKDGNKFISALKKAKKIAQENHIVTLGIIPDYPKTNYGYIKRTNVSILNGYKVQNFVEKPDESTAKKYLKDNNYFWNAGIFIFKVRIFLDELKKHSKEIFNVLEKIKFKKEKKKKITLDDYKKFKNISIDYAIMEKSNLLVVIPSDFGWNDIGGFASLYEILNKDKNNNVIRIDNENFINVNSKNIMVIGKNKKIVAIDIKNLFVIDTPDALLITNKNSTEKIKSVVENLKKNNSQVT